MVTDIVMCVECTHREAWSRGLCHACYKIAQRAGFLSDYPTKAFLDDPDSHVRWTFGLANDGRGNSGIELVADIAVEFGYKLVPLDY